MYTKSDPNLAPAGDSENEKHSDSAEPLGAQATSDSAHPLLPTASSATQVSSSTMEPAPLQSSTSQVHRIEGAVDLNVRHLTHWLPDTYVLAKKCIDGQLTGLRWPYNHPAHASFAGMVKRRHAKWDGEFWAFDDSQAAEKVLAKICKRCPDIPVLYEVSGEDPARVLSKVELSVWTTGLGRSACLLPFPLPRNARTTAISVVPDIQAVLLSASDCCVALLHGDATAIEDVVRDLVAQGASTSRALTAHWGMGGTGGAALAVRTNGWAIEIRADLTDPRHLVLKPKDKQTWEGVAQGQRPRIIPWTGFLHTTRKHWQELQEKFQLAGIEVEGDDPEAASREPRVFDTKGVGGWETPAPNGYMLHSYQREGALFCTRRGMRALVGDEMGVGKTAQAIAAAEACGTRRIVIVCPVSARYVWEREIQGWSGSGAIQHLYRCTDRLDPASRWHVVSYDALTVKSQSWTIGTEEEQAEFLEAFPDHEKAIKGSHYPKKVSIETAPKSTPRFKSSERLAAWEQMVRLLDNQLVEDFICACNLLLIVDEAHRVKNPNAKRTRAVARIASTNCEVLLLTGTPMRNHENEAAALLSLLDPCAAQELDKSKGYSTQDVRDYLSHLMIRRTKADVLPELPPKTRDRIEVAELDPAAMTEYQCALDSACIARMDAIAAGKSEAEARQAAQGYVESARKWLGLAKVRGGAIADFVADVVESSGCCVVFAAHQAVSDELAQQLIAQGLRTEVLDGRTPQKDRANIVSRFQGGDLDVLIGGINAAGEAITLTRADTVVFAELDWVPAAMLQAEDRIHRVGQVQNCQIRHVIARCSGFNLDAQIISILRAKLERIGTVLGESTDEIVSDNLAIKSQVLAQLIAGSDVPAGGSPSEEPRQEAASQIEIPERAQNCEGSAEAGEVNHAVQSIDVVPSESRLARVRDDGPMDLAIAGRAGHTADAAELNQDQREPSAVTVSKLDPKIIFASRWSNRDERSFSNRSFEVLKQEIAHAGGNVQPIKVRPCSPGYEIVFGHRRHRACLELGLPVAALIVEMDDRELWTHMERENRGRADLSPIEQGRRYQGALREGLFPSIRRLAESIGVDQSQASKVVRIAEFPASILEAFDDPNNIQVGWSSALHAALLRDPDAVAKRALKLGQRAAPRLSARATYLALLGREDEEPFLTEDTVMHGGSGARIVISTRKRGYAVDIIGSGIARSALEAKLKELLDG